MSDHVDVDAGQSRSSNRFGRFLRWSGVEKRQFLMAMVVLLLTKPALRTVGFKRWYALLAGFAKRVTWQMPGPHADTQVRRAVRILRLVIKHEPVRSNCLSRSLTLWWLLHSHGLDGDLRIGVQMYKGQFRAHAWIEYNGHPLNEKHYVRQVFRTFDSAIEPSIFEKLEQ